MLQRGGRVGRLVGDRAEGRQRHVAHQVHGEPGQRTERRQQLLGLLGGAQVRDGHRGERLASDRLGDLLERRELVGVEPEGQLPWGCPGHLGERPEHLPGLRGRPQQAAAVQPGGGVEVELDPGDDPEVATPAAERPEELGVLGRGDGAEPAGAVDELDGPDAVRADAILAPEPADPAGDRHADDGGVGVRAGEEGQPGALEGLEELAGLDAGADPGGAPPARDRDLVERAGAQQEHLVHPAGGAVARGLRAHLATVRAGPADRGDHVVGGGDLEHGQRGLLDVDHPGRPHLVPGRVGRGVQGAGGQRPELVQVVVEVLLVDGDGSGDKGHGWNLSSVVTLHCAAS